jgi:type IV pilus biogenesis protein CpaD/CtpE
MNANARFRARSVALAVALLAGALAGCATDGTGAPQAQAAPKPMTRTEAAKQCWMATEHGRSDLPLDRRADIVDKCIADKMSAAGKPAAAPAAPLKPKS